MTKALGVGYYSDKEISARHVFHSKSHREGNGESSRKT
jgi:hypothetical protein